MEKKLFINDPININDTFDSNPIKGVVRIYDMDGNLVVEKHNMVVKTGRHLLYNLFKLYVIDNSTTRNTWSSADNKDKIASMIMCFSYADNPIKTNQDLTLKQIEDNEKGSIKTEPSMDISADETELKITFKATINGSENFQKFNQIYFKYWYKEAGSTFESASNAGDVSLFSRVAMDPVFLGSDGVYSIHYSLYF